MPRHFSLESRAATTLTLLMTVMAQAQTPATAPAADDAAELATPAQTVEVESPVWDVEIASRLQRILETTERFTDPQVRVENGVVFLSGRTQSQDHRNWARELALKTQDVVAVVNNIQVEDPPLLNFEPALTELRTLGRQLIQALPLLVIGLIILGLTVLVSRGISTWITSLLAPRVTSEMLRGVIRNVVLVSIVLLGVYLFLRVSGLTAVAVAVLGGTGLIGLALGFAFRDIAENFLASLLLSMQRPFRIGDAIEVDGHLGIVQKVTTRGTLLMNFEGNYIQLANSTVYKSTIRNFSASPNGRLDFVVGAGYDAPIPRVQEIIMGVLKAHPAVLRDPEPTALVERFGTSTVDVRVYFWINRVEHSIFKVKSAVMRLTLRALIDAGISLPDEAREMLFPHPVPIRLLREEAAPPPGAGRQRPPIVPPPPAEHGATEAEGDLTSEVNMIQQQADASRSPEGGADILEAKSAASKPQQQVPQS